MAELFILDAGDDVSAEAITRGLQVGEALIIARGHTVELAYQAVLSRANNERHNPQAIFTRGESYPTGTSPCRRCTSRPEPGTR